MPITTTAEANRALAQLARVQAELTQAESAQEIELLAVRERHQARLGELGEQVAQVSGELLDWGAELASDDGVASVGLSFGRVQIMLTPIHVAWDGEEEDMLKRVGDLRPGLLNFSSTLDRNAARRMPAEELALLGLRLERRRTVEVKTITGVRLVRELP